MYEFNNQIYSYEDLLAIAQSKGYSFDELLSKNPEIKKAGKTTPPQKEDQGATVGAIQAPDTGSILEYTSSELQEIQNKFGKGKFTTAQRPAFEEYQKTGEVNKELLPAIEQEDDRFGFLGSLGLSFAKIPVNIRKQADNLRTFILDPIVQLSNPSMTNQERKEFIEKIPSAFGLAMPGAGISGAVDVSEKSKQILQNIQNKQMETSEKSIWTALKKGDVIDGAFLTADAAIQSLPSIGFSLAGPSAIFVHGALIAGEKYTDELEQSPKSTAEAIGYNALATGAIQAGSDFLFRGLASNAGIIAKQGTAAQAKEYLSNGFNRIAKKLLIGPGESLTEVSQNIANKYLDEWVLDRKFKFSEIKNELIDEAIVGWLMGSGTSMVSSMAGSDKVQRSYAEGLLMPEEIKQKLNKYSEEYNSIAEQYTAEENEEAKKVLDQRLAEMETEVAILSNKYKTALYAMDADETSEYAKNKDQIFKKQRALDKTTTKTGKNLLTSQINELNKSNNKILQDAAARQLEKTIETVKKSSPKLGIETEILSKKDISEQYGPKAAESDGFFKDKKIIINKEVASEVGAVNVAAHELLHGVLYTTLQNNPDTAIVLGDLLAKEIIKLNPDQIANSMLKRRLLLYKDDSKALQGEELLALFSDAVATGDIKYNENIFTKIGDGIRRILQNLGWKKIKFNSGKDVYNFIRDYNADIAKGGIRKKLIEQARKGFEGALIDKGVNIGKEINEEVAKFSKSEASDKVQQIYNSQGVAGAMDIIERFNPIVNKLVNKYRDVPGFEYQILKDEIETGQRGILDMIMAYDPEKNKGVPLAAYINKFLPSRMIEVANRNLGTEFTLDVTEAKGVTDTATEEQIEAAEEAIAADEIKSLRKEIGLPEELITKVKNSVIKAFGTRLPNPQDPKFRLELQRIFRTELKKPMAKFVGKQEAYESFLRDNFKAIYDKMPLSLVLRRFKEFAEPVLDENGKQKRERTAEGNKIFVKKKLTTAEFVKYFLGADVGRSTQGTRKTAIVEGIAEEIAFDATMEVLQDPAIIQKYQDIAGITGEVLPENFKSLIAKQVDRAENFKFSKSIIETAKAEYNLEQQSLADILNKNNLNTLSNKYSLISDALIYEADPANIKFSLTTKAEGEWTSDLLNPLDESRAIYKFKVGEIDYEINTFKDPLNYNYNIFEQEEGIEKGAVDNDPKSWGMTFATAKTRKVGVTGAALQGLTNQFKVFGTVANATIDLIKKEKLNSITFTGKEESRKRLYKSLNEKFAKELGWNTYDYTAKVPGGEESIFIAYDPKAFAIEPQITTPFPIKFSKSDSKFNVTAKKLLTPQGWAEWSNAKYEGAKILQDKIGNIQTKLGSQRPSYVISEKEIKGLDKLTNKEKQILREKINNLKKSIIAYEAKTDFNILKPNESFGNPAKKFGQNATEIFNNIKNGNIFKLQNTYSRIYDNMWEKYYEILEENPDMFDFLESTLQTSNNDVSHWHRLGAIFSGFDPTALEDFLTDKDGSKILKTIYTKQGKKQIPIVRTFEYEHAVQNHIQWKRVLDAAKRFAKNKNKKGFLDYLKKSKENYVLIAISIADSKKINEKGYAHVMPKNWKKWVDRYIASNIDLNKIVYINYSNNNATIDGNIASNFVIKESKSLNKEFNEQILQATTGVKWTENYSPATAKMLARGKGKGNLFIPYSAEDFVGLLYTTLGKGKVGNQQMEWYNENLIRPFSRGIQAYEAEKQRAMREWSMLKQRATKDVPGGLKKKNESGFTNEQSLRMYIWQRQGMEIPNIQKGEVNKAIRAVRNNEKFKAFADTLMSLNPEGYPEPSNNWVDGDITSDLIGYVNGAKRAEFLTQWKENVDQIFSEKNKTKLRALYGDRYVEALEDMLFRMEKGTNRSRGTNKQTRAWMDWVNNSVGTIMFFNARSAVLQTLSTVNFINFSDNNPINAAAALANFGQYRQDFVDLFNSDFLKQRRSGLQIDVNADEIAKATKGNEKSPRAILRALLQFGFTPTQIADSFAIAAGGATFYRNRINKYIKEGLSKTEAEKKAFTDFQEIAEETQQSARPDRISMEQASSLGRVILAFANTPMQYARLQKKAFLDLINGRGDWKTNTSKIMYYGVIQNVIFSALQQALFALMFDDEDEAEKKTRYYKIGNASLDTLLRGVGVGGAALATVKNIILEIIDQAKSKRPDYTQAAIAATSISPPINSKLRKLLSAGRAFTYKQSREKIFTEGFSLENPALLAAGQVLSAGANIPADRIVIKADHLYTAMQPETELWQAIALSLGWSEWDLGMIEKQTNNKQLTPKELKNLMKRKNIFKDLMKR